MIFSLPIKYNVPSAYKPINYTKVDSKLDGHLKGIDAIIGSISSTLTTGISNATVIAKVLTGYVSGAGAVAATDSILAAIQKLNGNTAALAVTVAAITPPAAGTVTGTTSTIANAPFTQIFNGSATHTVTLPAAASYTGKSIRVKTIGAYAVNSASSNVAPINSVTPGTAILAATAGKWAILESDGTNWIIIAQG